MRFLDVRTDFAFKKVFGSERSKNVLISFLNAIIDFGEEQVTDLTIVDPYQIPLLKGMKDSYVDVKAVLSNNKKVIVEMQVLNVEGFEKRVLYNAAKLYSTQLKKSGKYTTLEPIIALTITDFEMFPEFAKPISYWTLREREVLLQYSNDIELIFAELPKFTKTERELTGIADKWLYFVKHAGDLEFVPESFTEPQLLEAFEIANTAGLSEEELDIQFKRQDFIAMQQGAVEKAAQSGLERGIELGNIATARNMLRDQMPVETICKYTGLERGVVERLQQDDQE
ncbi:MAG: Rpn family recombination-promoting nuclease/putative transposase [Candidatus Electrothrix aestuarii]|uniref:Rpn family recombination-promoting nuclease/putative transposase n=1 Tax=Candidatus Electrothrix aestuarii TaxID=3062594 RepID=A0AAU8M1J0_9BACT|nr:Rpn family recombination-promoting nuclease/putative transposase [Candidatus Electrothrix aestuarii]